MSQELETYIKTELEKGTPKEEIKDLLITRGGWSEGDVEETFLEMGIEGEKNNPALTADVPRKKSWLSGGTLLMVSAAYSAVLSIFYYYVYFGSMQSLGMILDFQKANTYESFLFSILSIPVTLFYAAIQFSEGLAFFLGFAAPYVAPPIIFVFWGAIFYIFVRVLHILLPGSKARIVGLGAVSLFVLATTVPTIFALNDQTNYLTMCLDGEYEYETIGGFVDEDGGYVNLDGTPTDGRMSLNGASSCLSQYLTEELRYRGGSKEDGLKICAALSPSAEVVLDDEDERMYLPSRMSHRDYCVYKLYYYYDFQKEVLCKDYDDAVEEQVFSGCMHYFEREEEYKEYKKMNEFSARPRIKEELGDLTNRVPLYRIMSQEEVSSDRVIDLANKTINSLKKNSGKSYEIDSISKVYAVDQENLPESGLLVDVDKNNIVKQEGSEERQIFLGQSYDMGIEIENLSPTLVDWVYLSYQNIGNENVGQLSFVTTEEYNMLDIFFFSQEAPKRASLILPLEDSDVRVSYPATNGTNTLEITDLFYLEDNFEDVLSEEDFMGYKFLLSATDGSRAKLVLYANEYGYERAY